MMKRRMPTPKPVLSRDQSRQMASFLLQKGKVNEAAQVLSSILLKQANDTEVSLQLARLFLQHHQHNQACSTLERSASFGASGLEFFYLLSTLQHTFKKYPAAEKYIKKALQLDPKSAKAHNVLGVILLDSHRQDEAILSFQASLKLNSNSEDAHNNIAWAYRSLGEREKAIKHFQSAIKVNPKATEALSGLMLIKQFQQRESEFGLCENLLKTKNISPPQRAELEFALGKAFEDIKQYNDAFTHFEKGNASWRATFEYQSGDDEALFKQIKSVFSREYVNDDKNIEPINDTHPIFIVGMPRSSTSLIEQILASHSKVQGAGELDYLESICLKSPNALNWSTQTTSKDLQQFSDKYLTKLAHHSEGSPFVVDKMPQNFLFIGAIIKLFPKAKIIHCRRNPLDTCFSLYKHHFPMSKHKYAYDLKELGHYYGLYDDLMTYWHSILPGKIYDIQYESLVGNLETEVRALLDHCGLAYEASCLSFHTTKRVVRTASSEQVRSQLFSTAVGHWKHYENNLEALKCIDSKD